MKFNYKRCADGTLRPVIAIRLKRGAVAVDYEVLVDSGADLCLFHAEMGELLGLDIAKGKPREVFGVGGKASLYYLHTIDIEVGGWSYKVEAGFMPSVSGRVMRYGLVGQRGFFEAFIVRFDKVKEEIELKQR